MEMPSGLRRGGLRNVPLGSPWIFVMPGAGCAGSPEPVVLGVCWWHWKNWPAVLQRPHCSVPSRHIPGVEGCTEALWMSPLSSPHVGEAE